jgi:GH24 family phage-related lysozyme (muramidase)
MLNYFPLSQQQYVDLVINLISSAEGHEPTAADKGDGQRTIGYGYTFARSDKPLGLR